MAEHGRPRQNESNANSSDNHRRYNRCLVPIPVSGTTGKRKADPKREESIVNPGNPVQVANFMVGLPFWQPRHHYSLVYGHFTPAVLQPHLSQNYFHRPRQENRRGVRSTAHNVGENSINGLRFWEKVALNTETPGFTFSVMSYNVLAQHLLNQHPYLYRLHNKESLQWEVRWNNILTEIRYFHPDILCLQEVQKSHLETYFSILQSLGYRVLYKRRTGVRTDGCAIYYKPNMVNLVEHTTVEFKQPNVGILDRDNVALIAKFSPKNHPRREFVVATTHLLYNPRRQDVRLAQTQLLLTEIERIAFNPRSRYLPIIVTGDLNSTPDSAVYKFITKGKLKYEHLASRSLQNGVTGPKTGKNFLPTSLRITDQCQHADLLPKRQGKASVPRSEELKLIELKNSERNEKETKKHGRTKDEDELFGSGTLSHNFSLQSVYQHQSNGDVEGTTFQDEWVSVDYIFFSKRQPESSDLVLLERYRLPTKSELDGLRIPNTSLGSDHLSLLAKFQLKV